MKDCIIMEKKRRRIEKAKNCQKEEEQDRMDNEQERRRRTKMEVGKRKGTGLVTSISTCFSSTPVFKILLYCP